MYLLKRLVSHQRRNGFSYDHQDIVIHPLSKNIFSCVVMEQKIIKGVFLRRNSCRSKLLQAPGKSDNRVTKINSPQRSTTYCRLTSTVNITPTITTIALCLVSFRGMRGVSVMLWLDDLMSICHLIRQTVSSTEKPCCVRHIQDHLLS
jgi:hypothetical protein